MVSFNYIEYCTEFNSLSASDVNWRHYDVVACYGCSTSHRKHH